MMKPFFFIPYMRDLSAKYLHTYGHKLLFPLQVTFDKPVFTLDVSNPTPRAELLGGLPLSRASPWTLGQVEEKGRSLTLAGQQPLSPQRLFRRSTTKSCPGGLTTLGSIALRTPLSPREQRLNPRRNAQGRGLRSGSAWLRSTRPRPSWDAGLSRLTPEDPQPSFYVKNVLSLRFTGRMI